MNKSKAYIGGVLALVVLLVLWLRIPLIEPDAPLASALYAGDGRLLSARIAADGQWRFAPPDSLPEKYIRALLHYEDRRFYYHPGVDPVALVRAVFQNLRTGRVVSGASTLTMQLARMSRGSRPRDYGSKWTEAWMALHHELRYSKAEILRQYAAAAPFGGNVVGIEAAARRYFAKPPELLSWAEAATLAVLPNAPGLIFPGKNRALLLAKRDALLRGLADRGAIDSTDLALALGEDIPERPYELPDAAAQLCETLRSRHGPGSYHSAIRAELQESLGTHMARYYQHLSAQGIHNAAAVVMDHRREQVIAYVGNIPGIGRQHAPFVDLVQAPRSTGSILKPFLVMEALGSGKYTPKSWVRDIPCWIAGYHPENFHKEYDGLVSLEKSLIRSLNIPMVFVLQDLGIELFLLRLRKLGMSHMTKDAGHYGLSLVAGGAEASLWEVTNAYAAARRRAMGLPADRRAPLASSHTHPLPPAPIDTRWLTPGVAWTTLRIMQQLERPGLASQWKKYQGAPLLSWKTGTSHGFRDAWAVGSNADYTAGVWVGNADGEGRPGILGAEAAAPLLLDIFRMLPTTQQQTPQPHDQLEFAAVCRQSGMIAGPCCPRDTLAIPTPGLKSPPCPYHQNIWTDARTGLRALRDCADSLRDMCALILPPVEKKYLLRHSSPDGLCPDWSPECRPNGQHPMQWLYPSNEAVIYAPQHSSSTQSEVVFEIAHQHKGNRVFWYLNGQFLGQTQHTHQLPIAAPTGRHQLMAIDENGFELPLHFTLLRSDE